MIVVDVETAQRRWLPRMLQLSPRVAVFAAAPRPQAQPRSSSTVVASCGNDAVSE